MRPRIIYQAIVWNFFIALMTVNAMSMSVLEHREGRIFNMVDTRLSGITFELQKNKRGNILSNRFLSKIPEDFSSPGSHRIKVDYNSPRKVNLHHLYLQRLLKAKVDENSAWEVEISGQAASLGNWTLLSAVLQHLPQVMMLRWYASKPMPLLIHESLCTHHPDCRLYYTMYSDPSDEHEMRESMRHGASSSDKKVYELRRHVMMSELQHIIGSPILYSLSAFIDHLYRPPTLDLNFIYSLLTSCPNIRKLNLRISEECHSVAFNFTDTERRFPPLEVIILDGYKLDGKPDGRWWREWEADEPSEILLKFPLAMLPRFFIKWIGYPKIHFWGGLHARYPKHYASPLKPGERTNIDAWKDVMDWTHVHTLQLSKFPSSALLKLQGGVLPALKNLEIKGQCCGDEFSIRYLDFIDALPPLDSLSITRVRFRSVDEFLGVIFERHSPQLQNLRLNIPKHPMEYGQPASPPDKALFFNSSQLARFFHALPDLHTLDFDVEAKTYWDYYLFDTLISTAELQHLTLRFEEPLAKKYDDFAYERKKKEDEDERDLMIALSCYLKREKTGKQFSTLQIFVGSREIVSEGVDSESDDLHDFVEYENERGEIAWYKYTDDDNWGETAGNPDLEDNILRLLQQEMGS